MYGVKNIIKMATVNQQSKKNRLDTWNIVKFQILTHCFLENITVSDSDLQCLVLLSLRGESELTSFCTEVYNRNIFKSPQTVRNALSKAEKKKLILKEGKSKKKISIHPSLNIQTKGNILLDYKFLAIET